MDTSKSPQEQEEILEIARTLYGEERIKAYQLAGRDDLAREYANELLVADGDNYGKGPYAFNPYTLENWEVLRRKQKFDERGISYDLEAVKKGLRNTYIDVYQDRPSKEGIESIDDIFDDYDLSDEERMDFFVGMRERGKEGCWSDEIGRFCFGLEETGYSNLAARTGVSRKKVVAHYLDNLFFNERTGVNYLVFKDFLSEKLWVFMQKEDIDGEEIVSRAIRAVEEYKPSYVRPIPELARSDKTSRLYHLIDELSEIPTVKFPKDFVIKILNDYVKIGGELSEGYRIKELPPILSRSNMENDPSVRNLREESIRHEIERGPVCLLERVDYAIKEFGLDPKEGWLREALDSHLERWKDRSEEFELISAIYVGREYGLLPQEDIVNLERRLELVKKLRGKDR